MLNFKCETPCCQMKEKNASPPRRRSLGNDHHGWLPRRRKAQIQNILRKDPKGSQSKSKGLPRRQRGRSDRVRILPVPRVGRHLVRSPPGQHRAHHTGELPLHPPYSERGLCPAAYRRREALRHRDVLGKSPAATDDPIRASHSAAECSIRSSTKQRPTI